MAVPSFLTSTVLPSDRPRISAHRVNRNAVSAERCEECDEPIPEPRRAAVPGCQTCAECQIAKELKKKQRGL
ncbi:TPA: TraR/DksA C4-type zinc finger protein [Enterobacter kobei]